MASGAARESARSARKAQKREKVHLMLAVVDCADSRVAVGGGSVAGR